MKVPATKTVLSEKEIGQALREGHLAEFSVPPTINRLAMAWAQVCLETGRGKSLIQNNFGNFTCRPDAPGDHFELTTTEFMKGNGQGPKQMTLRYTAFASPQEGAAVYWRRLCGRYASALSLFDKGDGMEVARELSRLRYFTAPYLAYGKAMSSLFAEFSRKYAEDFRSQPPPDDDIDVLVMPPLEIRAWPPGGSNDGGGENA